jgi:adenylate cyclase, class 2
MVEVEAKVRLTDRDYKRLSKAILAFAKPLGVSLKVDRYYDQSGIALRIREEGGVAVLTAKIRKRKKGIEMNQEIEIPIRKAGPWDRMFRKNGFPLIARKEKRCLAFHFRKFRIELNTVKGLGHFLEIERLVKGESEVLKAKQELVALFRKLGFGPATFERKLYLELLAEKGKNRKVSK